MQTSYNDDHITIKLTAYEADEIRRALLYGMQEDDRLDYLWQVLTGYVRASEKSRGDEVPDHEYIIPGSNRQDETGNENRFKALLASLFDPASNEHNPYP